MDAATIAHRKAAILNGDSEQSGIHTENVKHVETTNFYEPDPLDSTQIKYPKALDLIGNTPLVDLTSLCNAKPGVRVLAKAEFMNREYLLSMDVRFYCQPHNEF
eukprot:m.195551 g.195551  ORF g.195551 m.195551 type:complete len:104 (+) comp18678_c0_seq5:458-769(+)